MEHRKERFQKYFLSCIPSLEAHLTSNWEIREIDTCGKLYQVEISTTLI